MIVTASMMILQSFGWLQSMLIEFVHAFRPIALIRQIMIDSGALFLPAGINEDVGIYLIHKLFPPEDDNDSNAGEHQND